MTHLTSWQKQPDGIIGNVFAFLDPISGYALSAAERRTQSIFLPLLEKLIGLHFHCATSTTLSPIDHHRALTISSSPYAVSFFRASAMTLQGPKTVDYKVSNDLTQALSSLNTLLYHWDLTQGLFLHSFVGHTSHIELIDISKDGTWALTKSDTEVKIWDLKERVCLRTITEKELLFADELILIPDQKKVLAKSVLDIQLWDLTTEKCLLHVPGSSQISPVISADGNTLLMSYENGDLEFYSLLTGKCVHIIETTDYSIDCLAMNAQGNAVYTASLGKIKIWDRTTGQLLQTIDTYPIIKIDSLLISGDGKKIISNNWDGSVSIWHQPTGKYLETLRLNGKEAECHKISPDGTIAVLANNSFKVQFLHLAPLPHEHIDYVAALCSARSPYALRKFEELPSFVKKKTRTRAYQRLCDYSTTNFLPFIRELFKRAESAKSEKEEQYFSAPAFNRFKLLPLGVQKPVYDRLGLRHGAQGKLRNLTILPKNYGEQAFHNTGPFSATHEERIEAIRGISHTALAIPKKTSTRKKRRNK